MGSGFQAFSQDGSNVVQIDGDAGVPNLGLLTKYTVVTTSVYASSPGGSSTATDVLSLAGAVNPIVALYCVGAVGRAATLLWMDGTNFQVVCNGPVGTTIEIYIFGKPTDSGQKCFQVFDASGNLVFDAGRAPMRVRGQWAPSALGALGTLPAGPKYAAVVTSGSSRTYQAAGPTNYIRYDLRPGVHLAGGSLNQIELYGVVVDYEPITAAGTSYGMNNAHVLILDVTGL